MREQKVTFYALVKLNGVVPQISCPDFITSSTSLVLGWELDRTIDDPPRVFFGSPPLKFLSSLGVEKLSASFGESF